MSNQFYCKICGGLFNRPAKGNKRLFCDGCKPQAEKVYQAEYYKRKKAEKEQMRADAALGAAVRKEIAELEHKRDNDCILSDIEDEWLNDLQTLVAEAGLMKGEER